jgi:hypothetical protein
MSTVNRRKGVDELLAAPASVRDDPEELRKYRERKAAIEAAANKRATAKKKKPPTTEDLLADIVRVATDPLTNPWHEYHSISRKRYRLFGWYPEGYLDRFGTWTRALEVAGLRSEAGTRLLRASRAQSNQREHVARYVERYVEPYALKRDRFTTLSQAYLLLSISDTHATFLCPFTWHSFLSAIRDLQPDGVLLNGDILEGAEISRHPKIPGWSVPLQVELDFAREMVRQIRAVGHDGDLLVGGGNHGVDRLASYLAQVAPALANLRCLRIDELLGLDSFDVQLLQSGTIASPAGTSDHKPGALLWDSYRIHHGTYCGGQPAAQELRAAGRSGQSGHVHRAHLAHGTTEAQSALSWMSTPAGCTERAARSYIRATTTGWQKGFGLAYVFPDGAVRQYPVLTDNDVCVVEGFCYRRPAKLPDPPVGECWIEQLPLPEVRGCRRSERRPKSSRRSVANSGKSRSTASAAKSSRAQRSKH